MASGASSSLSLFLLHAKEMVFGLTSVGSRDCNWDEAREGDRDEGSDMDDVTGRGAQMLTTGRGAQMLTTGRGAQMLTTGRGAQMLTTGREAQMLTTGRGAQMWTTGRGAQMLTTGRGAQRRNMSIWGEASSKGVQASSIES